MTSDSRLTILHVSDLHFGWKEDRQKHAERRLVLNGLLQTLSTLDPEWRPTCVCITGDVGGKGRADDYAEARDWLAQLLETLHIGPEALIVCPGNHDVDRQVARQSARPSSPKEADEVLGDLPPPQHHQDPFLEFDVLCRGLGIPPVRVGDWENRLVGSRMHRGVRFVCLNSAWFSKSDDDKDKLWMGLPHLKVMESGGQLPSRDQRGQLNCPVTITLVHHPEEFLHESERQEAPGRQNTFGYLAERCHAILTGHTHDAPRPADRKWERAWHFRGGAAYTGAEHTNSFRVIRVETDGFTYRCFEYRPGSPDFLWTEALGATILPYSVQPAARGGQTKARTGLPELREKAAVHACRLVETKSRAIKQFGALPEAIPLTVAVHDRAIAPRFGERGRLVEDPKQRADMPLYQAAKLARNTLVLGDLGSGKSTLSGMFAGEVQERNQDSLALAVVAKDLVWDGPSTPRGLLGAVSRYVRDRVALGDSSWGLEQVLDQGVELTLVLDGLDEVPLRRAGELLNPRCPETHRRG
jgi:hypothetical protein